MIELVVFLGNPGREYERNRHNAGRLLAAKLPFSASLLWRQKYKGRYAVLDGSRLERLEPEKEPLPPRIHFLMPETYMNLSGESVCTAALFFRIPPERILLVHDELELPLGTAALKFSGGLGGHNGLRSVKAGFGTADFWRLRIGIGRPNHDDISGWVLSDFSRDEAPVLEQVLEASAAALVKALAEGPEALLPEWHKKKIAVFSYG
jgi:PTH1 family peptidyl-tRNA hydrolase